MKYMTVTDVKDRWGVSSDVVYDYIAAGRLKAVKFGRAWRIKQCDCRCKRYGNHTGNLLCNLHGGSRRADGIRRYFMITFLSGMAAGAAALLGLFKACCVRWERMERNKRRRAKRARAAQNKPRGFCGDIRRDNSWMQETTRL